jgi:hypothetical protein
MNAHPTHQGRSRRCRSRRAFLRESAALICGGTDLRLGQAMRLAATRSAELCRLAAKIEATESRALAFHVAGVPNSTPG